MSAESGLTTFRDAGGLWEQYPVMDVASADGFRRNPELVHRFYNDRRRQLLEAKPNRGHLLLAELEKDFDVRIITQNVDDLHERAGSSNVLHLHGELMKIRSVSDPNYIETLTPPDIETTPQRRGARGDLMRPHIVFFQEAVPNIEPAVELVGQADAFVVIGTSMAVYPAASLVRFVRPDVPTYYIDPNPAPFHAPGEVDILRCGASEGVERLGELLRQRLL